MDLFMEFGREAVDWTVVGAAIPILAAALPSVLLLLAGRLPGLAALGVIAGAIALIVLGADELVGAVVVVAANGILLSVLALGSRRRLKETEERLDQLTSSIRDLELAEERRQTFSARGARPARTAGQRS